jgi:hypothetical protein
MIGDIEKIMVLPDDLKDALVKGLRHDSVKIPIAKAIKPTKTKVKLHQSRNKINEMNTQKDFLIQQIKGLLTDKETSIHNLRLFLQNSIVTTIESWEEGALGHWMNIGKFRAQAWDQAQKLSEIQKNINPSEKSDASTILKEYSEVILADQAQKLTDIIDGIIKSFKHDNKILKHIEDVSSNQRKVLSVLHTLPDRDETAKNIQASINEMNEVFKEVQDTYETTKQSLKQGLVTLQNLVNSMENDEISSNTISKVEQKMRRISRQLKMEKPHGSNDPPPFLVLFPLNAIDYLSKFA